MPNLKDILMDHLDEDFVKRLSGVTLILREYLMSIRQTQGNFKGCPLFFSISRGTESDQISFFYFKSYTTEAYNVINGLVKMCEVELRVDLNLYFTLEGIEQAATGHGDTKHLIYRDGKELYAEEISAEMIEDVPAWENQEFNQPMESKSKPTETVLNPGHAKMMATVVEHPNISNIPTLAPGRNLRAPSPLITPIESQQ